MTSRIPPELGSALTDPGHSILLLLAAEAGERYERAAIAAALATAGEGRVTLLADGAVTAPHLHRVLGVENLEGLADIFLFGASLARVARRPDGYAFDFVPAGAYVPDPAGVLDSPRWGGIAAELQATKALLLLYVPALTPGVGALSRRLGRAVIIGTESEASRAAARLDRGCRVLATVPPQPGPESGVDPAISEEPRLTEPVVLRKERSVRATPLRLASLLAITVALVAGGLFLYRSYFPGPARGVGVDAPPQASAPSVPRGEPVETPLPVSVAVEAHQDLTTALQRIESLRRAEPRIGFFLSPVAVSGGVYYRLLAGPVGDAAGGTALLQRLVDAGHKTAFDSWAVRPTEYSFFLGEYDSAAAAEGRVEELVTLEIPAYVVRVRYDPGPPRFRVYGGAFESPAEAEVMRRMLDEAELEAELLPRTGDPVA
jgi:hypothetical protein